MKFGGDEDYLSVIKTKENRLWDPSICLANCPGVCAATKSEDRFFIHVTSGIWTNLTTMGSEYLKKTIQKLRDKDLTPFRVPDKVAMGVNLDTSCRRCFATKFRNAQECASLIPYRKTVLMVKPGDNFDASELLSPDIKCRCTTKPFDYEAQRSGEKSRAGSVYNILWSAVGHKEKKVPPLLEAVEAVHLSIQWGRGVSEQLIRQFGKQGLKKSFWLIMPTEEGDLVKLWNIFDSPPGAVDGNRPKAGAANESI